MGRKIVAVLLAGASALGSSACPGPLPVDPPEDHPQPTRPPDAPAPAPRALAPPRVPDVAAFDRDHDRIEDALAQGPADTVVDVEAVFEAPVGDAEVAAFVAAGGSVRRVFRAISHGFGGRIPRRALAAAAKALGPRLLLLHRELPIARHLDHATRTGRARPVWATGFAGTTGLSGSGVNIAILDTGFDNTHPDLAGRMIGWKDYSNDGYTSPVDYDGHGSHVAGIALGSGAAFGVGPGPLHYTDTDDLSFAVPGQSISAPIRLPASFDWNATATWTGPGTTIFGFKGRPSGGSYEELAVATDGPSGGVLSYEASGSTDAVFSIEIAQNAMKSINGFAVTATVSPYPAVGDGFPAFRGVAASAGWFGGKVFSDQASSTTGSIDDALDDLLVQTALEIKVVNLSLGVPVASGDPTLRAKVNTLVDNGVVVVCSAGNDGETGSTEDPGRAASAITVGSVTGQNVLTSYTSGGYSPTSSDVGADAKPDLLAPGGSPSDALIVSVDSNTSDGRGHDLADAQPNDYTGIAGTSMASPFVAGSAALVIEALGKSGAAWTFGSASSPLLVKMLLLASATETNANRENDGIGPTHPNGPFLGRSKSPSDRGEGYGLVNPDAAVESVLVAWDGQPFTASTTGAPTDRRAWGRKVTLGAGQSIGLHLTSAATADYDLYLYGGTPGPNGHPIIVSSSDAPTAGASESVAASAAAATTLYAVVKRISGSGDFTLVSCAPGDATVGCASLADAGAPPAADAGEPDASSPPGVETSVPTGTAPPASAPTSTVPASPTVAPAASAPAASAPAGESGGCNTTGAPSRGLPSSALLLFVVALTFAVRRGRAAAAGGTFHQSRTARS